MYTFIQSIGRCSKFHNKGTKRSVVLESAWWVKTTPLTRPCY